VTALKAELAELRQQLAEAQRKLEEARQGNEYWRGCNTELAAERDQLQAQVVVLTEALEPFAAKATTWRPERGSDSVVHVSMPIRYYREAADALANLPALATALLSERERMRVALANAIEAAVEQKMHTGMVCVASCDTDGECCRQVSNLMASERCYQRAREALRKEDTATDA